MKANQKIKSIPKQPVKPSPETIEERVHRHISDINSKITDDDIKSVKTELDIRSDSPNQPEEENGDKKKKKRNSHEPKKDEEGRKEKDTTPWDLLSDGYE